MNKCKNIRQEYNKNKNILFFSNSISTYVKFFFDLLDF